jgi:hypothetical protein
MASNKEFSHRRFVTTMSYWARLVQHVRHLDMDLYQYCEDCLMPEVFFEGKTKAGTTQWEMTRRFADRFGVPALLVEENNRVIEARCAGAQSGCPCPEHTHGHGGKQTVTVTAYKNGHGITRPMVWDRTQFVAKLQGWHTKHLAVCQKKRPVDDRGLWLPE